MLAAAKWMHFVFAKLAVAATLGQGPSPELSADGVLTPGVRWTWSSPASCGPGPDFSAEIGKWLSGAPPLQPTQIGIEIEAVASSGAYRARVRVEGAAAEGTHELVDANCQQLADTIALLLAITVDPSAQASPPASEEPAPAKVVNVPEVPRTEDASRETHRGEFATRSGSAIQLERPSTELRQQRRRRRGRTPRRKPRSRAARPTTFSWRTGVQLGRTRFPHVHPALSLGLEWQRHWWLIKTEILGEFPGVQRGGEQTEQSIIAGATLLEVSSCLAPRRKHVTVSACGLAALGPVWARGRGAPVPGWGVITVASFGVQLALRTTLVANYFIEWSASGLLTHNRINFSFSDGSVQLQGPPVGVRGAIGFGRSFGVGAHGGRARR